MTDAPVKPVTKRGYILRMALWILAIGVPLLVLGWWFSRWTLVSLAAVMVTLGVAWLVYVLVTKDGDPISPAYRRYMRTVMPAMGGYMLAIMVLTSIKPHSLPVWGMVLVALLPVVPMVLVVISMWRYTRESDELRQRIQREAVFITCGVVGILAFALGMLEMVKVIHIDSGLFYVLPLMFAIYGLASRWCARKYGVKVDC